MEDLEQSILRLTELIFLPRSWDRSPINILQRFCHISIALFLRVNASRQPEDVKHSTIYLRYLRRQSHEALNVTHSLVTGIFVRVLGVQVELKLGNVMSDIEEMAVLCHELLNSDISTTSLTGPIMALTRAVESQLASWVDHRETLEKVVPCLREANRRLPDLDEVSIMIAGLLYSRFVVTYSDDDYEEGTAVLEKINRLSLWHEEALGMIAVFAHTRSSMIRKPEYLEDAIHRFRTFLDGSSLEDTSDPITLQSFALLQKVRFDDFGVTEDPQDKYSRNSKLFVPPSFRDLSVSLASSNSGESPSKATELQHNMALVSLLQNTDVADLQEAVEYCRRLGASSHSHRELAPQANMTLGVLLHRAFLCSSKIEYLNEAISIYRAHINNPPLLQRMQCAVIQGLIACLSIRFHVLHYREDFNEIMQLFPVAVNNECEKTSDRFQLSCDWASASRLFGHPSALTAYKLAISLMQESLTFAPTLHIQHSCLVAMRSHYENLPLDYASFQVHTGRLHQAVETLEQGRALLWSEMRGLRTSIDQLRAADSRLADRFATVNRDLEMLTLTDFPYNVNLRDGVVEGMDPFGHLVVRQRKLLDDRDKLISQIQAMPGFDTFLKSPSFDNLRSAAAHGPIIMINHCRWRSDIQIGRAHV